VALNALPGDNKIMSNYPLTTANPSIAVDQQRRGKLRSFLTECRARLQPDQVGLARTPRRRVVGLRREEVAELAEVSNEWYRLFESGRPIRVSPSFLARLGQALRLSAAEQLTLFTLGLPELYEVAA
jgi:transcriptional regulator with XRE-family HTH domain